MSQNLQTISHSPYSIFHKPRVYTLNETHLREHPLVTFMATVRCSLAQQQLVLPETAGMGENIAVSLFSIQIETVADGSPLTSLLNKSHVILLHNKLVSTA